MVIGLYKTIDQITDEKRLYCRCQKKDSSVLSLASIPTIKYTPNIEFLPLVDETPQVFYGLLRHRNPPA